MSITSTNGKLHHEVAALQKDLGRVRKDLGDMGATLLDHGRRTFQAAGTDVQERAEQTLHNVQGYIKTRPVTCTLLALGAGLIFGALWTRK